MEIDPRWMLKFKKDREYARRIQKEQEVHKLDILQPGNPIFEKVWGAKVRKQKEELQKQQKVSKDLWRELKERKEFEARK